MQSKERAMPGQTALVFDNDDEEEDDSGDGSDDDHHKGIKIDIIKKKVFLLIHSNIRSNDVLANIL